MKILVTGKNGYIGSSIINKLKAQGVVEKERLRRKGVPGSYTLIKYTGV